MVLKGIFSETKYKCVLTWQITSFYHNSKNEPLKRPPRLGLRLNKENFEDEESPHKLFLKIRQTTKIRKALASHMSTEIRPSRAQISKIIQSGGFLGKTLGKLGKKSIVRLCCFFG